MRKLTVKVGEVFGHLTVLSPVPREERNTTAPVAMCECACGTIKAIRTADLIGKRNGKGAQSCGCQQHVRGGAQKDHPAHRNWQDACRRGVMPEKFRGAAGFKLFCQELGEQPTPEHRRFRQIDGQLCAMSTRKLARAETCVTV